MKSTFFKNMECTTGVYLEWSHSEKSAGVWSVLSRKLQLFLEWSVPGVTPIIAGVSNSLAKRATLKLSEKQGF